MYPVIRDKIEKYNIKWKLSNEELNKIYEEQKELFDIFHEENSRLSFIDERDVRFCLNCKMYYKTNYVTCDVNINLCSGKPCHPDQTKCCLEKLINEK